MRARAILLITNFYSLYSTGRSLAISAKSMKNLSNAVTKPEILRLGRIRMSISDIEIGELSDCERSRRLSNLGWLGEGEGRCMLPGHRRQAIDDLLNCGRQARVKKGEREREASINSEYKRRDAASLQPLSSPSSKTKLLKFGV